MCACGRKRNQTVTSAQLVQDQAQADQHEANEAMRELGRQTITAAEQMLASAAKAARNARS